MDLLISVIIVGMAAGYVTETIAMVYDRPYVRLLSTLSMSGAGLYFLGVWGADLILATFASGFLSALLLKVINRPVVLNSSLRR
jgi:hypothetical protein